MACSMCIRSVVVSTTTLPTTFRTGNTTDIGCLIHQKSSKRLRTTITFNCKEHRSFTMKCTRRGSMGRTGSLFQRLWFFLGAVLSTAHHSQKAKKPPFGSSHLLLSLSGRTSPSRVRARANDTPVARRMLAFPDPQTRRRRSRSTHLPPFVYPRCSPKASKIFILYSLEIQVLTTVFFTCFSRTALPASRAAFRSSTCSAFKSPRTLSRHCLSARQSV